MTLPAPNLNRGRPVTDGLKRSAALMQALGSQASSVWAALSPEDTQRLSEQMSRSESDYGAQQTALEQLHRDLNRRAEQMIDPSKSIWERLSAFEGTRLANLLTRESPQVLAVILSKLDTRAAAATVRALPRGLATEALKRLLTLGPIHPAAQNAIQSKLEASIGGQDSAQLNPGDQRVAKIFDSLSGAVEMSLLNELEKAEPGAGKRVRALMFTFDDLADLGPASLQTLLTHIDRSTLITSLKGAKAETANAFYSNMTARARELLIGEIESMGPMRRLDIENARQEIARLAKSLINRGDILAAGEDQDDLVE